MELHELVEIPDGEDRGEDPVEAVLLPLLGENIPLEKALEGPGRVAAGELIGRPRGRKEGAGLLTLTHRRELSTGYPRAALR
jgi:hypothetical protein